MKPNYKIVNHKKRYLCDYHGECTNLAYMEVYPGLGTNKKLGWSYLCRKHYKQEQKHYKGKLACCKVD